MNNENGTTRLLSLEAENVMRLRAVRLEFDPAGELKIIGGGNGQGKTSVLRALAMAMGGGKAQVEKVIRDGEKGATVIVDLDAFKVTCNWTEKGRYLKVASKDGRAYQSPQAMLDGLFGALGFDPLAFTTMDAKRQAETLKALVGIDFTDLDAKRKRIFDERTIVGRDVTALKGQLAGMPHNAKTPVEEVSVAVLAEELTKAIRANGERIEHIADRDRLMRLAEECFAEAEKQRGRMEELQEEIKSLNVDAVHLSEKALEHQESSNAMTIPDVIDTAPYEAKIATAEQTNAAVRQNKARANVKTRLDAATEQQEDLSAQLDAIDREKEATLAAAEFPVAGLGFDDSGVTFNNIPFSQAGSAEKLRVSTAMGLAMNKDLKLLLIDDGERLDKDGLKLVADMAAEAGATILMTRVSVGPECSVIIQDGEIVEASTERQDDE